MSDVDLRTERVHLVSISSLCCSLSRFSQFSWEMSTRLFVPFSWEMPLFTWGMQFCSTLSWETSMQFSASSSSFSCSSSY